VKKSELKQMIKEELLKEGAKERSAIDAAKGLLYIIRDFKNAVNGKNGGDVKHSQSKFVTDILDKMDKQAAKIDSAIIGDNIKLYFKTDLGKKIDRISR